MPSALAPALVPSNSSIGASQVAPDCVSPLIIVVAVMAGKGKVKAIVFTPLPGMLKLMTVISGLALAVVIACRSEPEPLLLVFVTIRGVGLNAVTTVQSENSEVSNGAALRVTVAVTKLPTDKEVSTSLLYCTCPLAFVVTSSEPQILQSPAVAQPITRRVGENSTV